MGSILLCVVCGTVITVVSMKVPAGSKSLSCINKGCFVRVLLAVMCLSGNSCLMAARVSLVGSRMKERRQAGLYFNIAAIYGHRAESYIDLNLIMILLALIKFVYFQRFRLHTETEKRGQRKQISVRVDCVARNIRGVTSGRDHRELLAISFFLLLF